MAPSESGMEPMDAHRSLWRVAGGRFRRLFRASARMRAHHRAPIMMADMALAGGLALALAVYLVVALLNPERF
jgi:K+-transporting ATPase KdpF subunit